MESTSTAVNYVISFNQIEDVYDAEDLEAMFQQYTAIILGWAEPITPLYLEEL